MALHFSSLVLLSSDTKVFADQSPTFPTIKPIKILYPKNIGT